MQNVATSAGDSEIPSALLGKSAAAQSCRGAGWGGRQFGGLCALRACERSLHATGMAAGNAAPTDVVVRVVAHALESKLPRTRYVVGADAYIVRFLARTLSDRSFDWLLRKLDETLERKLARA